MKRCYFICISPNVLNDILTNHDMFLLIFIPEYQNVKRST